MPTIHPTAIIDESATIAADASVGPYCIIGPNCHIGEGTRLRNHVTLICNTTLGKHNDVYPNAVLGGDAQDYKFKGEEAFLAIGDHNVIRENVTLSRATGEGMTTVMGNHNMMMAYSHMGHNSSMGDYNTIANTVQIAGHVDIANHVTIGGMAAVHQGVKIGSHAMIGGCAAARMDVPPFALMGGNERAVLAGINVIGLRRAGIDSQERTKLKRAFRILFFENTPQNEAIAMLKSEDDISAPAVQKLIDFMEADSSRGISRSR